MLGLVRQMYPRHYPTDGAMSRSHVVLEEVAPGTGFWGEQRWADVLVLGTWPSKGLELHGFEIKASKQDLKKELGDPDKANALARYCNRWSLVAWDESILVDGIPETWGIHVTVEEEDEGRVLKTLRQPKKLTPELRPWPFVCSLVRNAYEQSPGAAYLARACEAAYDLGKVEGKRRVAGDYRAATMPIAKVLFGDDEWKWSRDQRTLADDPVKLLARAAERLSQGELGAVR